MGKEMYGWHSQGMTASERERERERDIGGRGGGAGERKGRLHGSD